MDRPTHETAPPTATGMFNSPPAGGPVFRAARPEASQFDPVSFRQSAGLTRPAAHEAAVAKPLSDSGHAQHMGRYAVAWAGLGVVSAVYLGALFWQRAGGLDMALAPVTESIERMATDIAELKQTTAAIDARERETANRMAVAETRLDSFAQVAAAAPQATAMQGQRPLNRAQLEATPAPAVSTTPPAAAPMAGATLTIPPHPPARPFVTATVAAAPPSAATSKAAAHAAVTAAAAKAPVNDALISPIRTGSVPPAAATSRPVGVLVASGPSLNSIRLSWNVLNQNHGAVLGSLEPRILPTGDGSAFQLIAGPFASDAEAQKACASLKARGVGCRPAEFSGAPL